MSIWGTILGGAAGYALGGPLGALVGAAAGHAFDRLRAAQPVAAGGDALLLEDRTREAPGPDATRRIAFTIGVIVLGAKMAKADGRVTRNEVEAFKEVFHVPPEEMKNVGRLFDRARRDAQGFEPYARQIARLLGDRRAVLEDLLDGLFHIAKADGGLRPAEVDYLRRVAGIFGFSDPEFERIRAGHGDPEATDPYRVLGVAPDADDAAVKAAYRALIREHHPDRLVAQGLPQEFVEIATEKLAAINVAYERIRRARGSN